MKNKRAVIDFPLFIVILILLAIGINMVFSASMYEDSQFYSDSYYHLKRQIVWAAMGITAMLFMASIDYRKLKSKRILKLGMIGTFILLILVLLPTPLSISRNGASRWFGYGTYNVQPSEIAKIAIILYTSDYISRKGERMKQFFKGVLPILVIAAVYALLIIKEPNMSTCVIIMVVVVLMVFMGGAKVSHMLGIFATGVAGAVVLVKIAPYRMERFLSFLDPWADPLDTGYQAIQSLYALGAGGFFGSGFGQSRQKLYYIPEAQNDFILSIIGEEMGFIGIFIIILLFAILVWRGMRIAINCKDKFGSLVAAGITALIAVQSSINFLVVSSFMPITGVTLPLISYGGSSLLFTMIMLGILLSISRYGEDSISKK
jgi:cell division protein FtsW